MDNIEVLISREEIDKRVLELANILHDKYKDEELVFVITLKGACPFGMNLFNNYNGKATLEFVRVSSYIGENSTGNIELKLPLKEENIKDKNVLIVEDIVDTGNTLMYLRNYVKELGCKNVEEVTLLNKESRRTVDIKPTYIGFDIEDHFVLGYGLDYDEYYRNLNYIGYIEK